MVPDDKGNNFIPSCVAFTEDGPLIGEGARLWAIENPEATICNPRALLGRKWSDQSVQTLIKNLPYKVTGDHQDRPVFNINVGGDEKAYTVEYVTSLIIKELKHMAEAAMGGNETVTEAVIAVPSHYSDQQRQAVKDAGYLAGVDVLSTSSEPVAAAVGYGVDAFYTERNIIVFDIGDTLDVSVLNVDDGIFESLASSHHNIGGERFNQRIIGYITRQWKKRTGIDLTTNPSNMRRLDLEVEKAKILLSSNKVAIVDLGSVNSALTATLTRAKFEELVKDLFVEAVEVIRRNLNEAKLNFTDIDDVIITGGSGNIPKIREMVEEAFSGKMPSYSLRNEATVIGAARRGVVLSTAEDELCGLYFPDLSPLDFGIETADGVMANVAPQNIVPFITSWNFTTAVDGQSSMLIRVLEGQRVLAANNLVIGEFELPLTPAPAGVPRVEITFRVGVCHNHNLTNTNSIND
ncbi:heat shock protein 70 family [Xylaria digitata]|nr:heat shock protein 70 family [Xylaria digitata]